MEDIKPIDIMNYPFWNAHAWDGREFQILAATMMRSHTGPGSEFPKNILTDTMKKPKEEYEKEIKINYLGVINCTRVVLDHFVEKKAGRIVNVASDSGRVGEPREAVYSGTKGAVIAFSKAIAKEMGRFGINVNTICPGATIPEKPGTAGKDSMWAGDVTQDMIPAEVKEKIISQYPLQRMGKPEDTANAAVFLASDGAAFITGQTLSVSGGFSMC